MQPSHMRRSVLKVVVAAFKKNKNALQPIARLREASPNIVGKHKQFASQTAAKKRTH